MSLRVYTHKSKEKLKLHPKAFASGGEGKLHKILSPAGWTGHVVKLYHPEKLTSKKEQKINYLLRHQPITENRKSIVWVKDIIRDEKGRFLGFAMPFIKGEKLEILCSTNLPNKLRNSWYRFHRESEDSMELRLKVCYNLASAVHKVHACGRYILVDLKPDNVIISPDGLLSLVDLDSVEITENGQVLFEAPVATPEFTPPEYYKESLLDPTQQQSWDRFSIAVIFYKIICGIHPFAGTFLPPYENANNLSEKIKHNLFVHSKSNQKYTNITPPLHNTFYSLSNSVQELFIRCFEVGGKSPEKRPSASEWCSTFMQHLDLHRFRVLPSKQIIQPISPALFKKISKKSVAPDIYVNKIKTEKKPIDKLPLQKPENYNKNFLRRIALSILLSGICFSIASLVYRNTAIGFIILIFCFLVFFIICFLSFGGNQYEIINIAKREMDKNEKFLKKQRKLYNEIKNHLSNFFNKLTSQKNKIYTQGGKAEGLKKELQLILNEMFSSLKTEDKLAKNLLESENFEYGSLKDKYLRAMHTHPSFSESVSLDSEYNAIDFALQEEMEMIQKNINKAIKRREFETNDEEERSLQKINKNKNKIINEINQYRRKLMLTQKQEEKKLYFKIYRSDLKYKSKIKENIDQRISLFKEEIVTFLEDNNIVNINQIKNIEPPGILHLDKGVKISVKPLKYYQINQLIEWWHELRNIPKKLPDNLRVEISNKYEKILKDYKKIRKEDFDNIENEILKIRKEKSKEKYDYRQKIKKSNQLKIEKIRNKYKEEKEFLKKLWTEREKEEKEIHERYKSSFDEILKKAQLIANNADIKIKTLYGIGNIPEKEINQYLSNLKKYELGLKRLEEEYLRLMESTLRWEAKMKKYNQVINVNFTNHLKFMLYLKSS